MDASNRKEDPSLPPDYVSLAQLQERWIQKQQEKKLKKKEEDEKKEKKSARARNENQNQRALKNDGHEKIAGLTLRDVPWRRVEKDSREMRVISDKGKGKEIENRKKKSAAVGEKGNEVGKEKFRSEIRDFGGGDGCEGVEIVPKNEVKVGIGRGLSGENSGRGGISSGLKGIKKKVSASMVEVSPRNGVMAEIPNVKRMDYRSGYKSKKEYRVRLNDLKEAEAKVAMEKKMEDEKGYDKKLGERRNGNNLKCNEVELESDNKAKDETSDVLNGRDENVLCGQSNKGRNKNKEHRVEGKGLKKMNNEALVAECVKNDELGSVRNGYRRHRNCNGNIRRNFGKVGNVISRDEVNVGYDRRYAISRRFEDRKKTRERESGMIWVKKEAKSGSGAAEVGTSGISVDQE